MTSLRALVSLAFVAVAGVTHVRPLHAQAAVDTTRRASDGGRWTAQEISDACSHKPGARMRLYGCRPESFIPRQDAPLYVVDGEALPTDTAGPGRLARDSAFRTIDARDVVTIQVLKGDSAVKRFGPSARFGAVLVTTRRLAPRVDSVPRRAPRD